MSESVKHTNVQGDASVSRHGVVGGDMNVHGHSTFGHDVKVKGWLDAPNVRGACKGMFATEEDLNAAFPLPMPGWYAYVGDALPAPIYRAKNGKWVPTGEVGGGLTFGENDTIKIDPGTIMFLLRLNPDTLKLDENGYLTVIGMETKGNMLNVNFPYGFSINGKRLVDLIRYYDDPRAEATDRNIYTALMTDQRIEEELEAFDDKYIRKDRDDTASGLVTFLKGIKLGHFVKNVSGGYLDKDGNAELAKLLTRGLATLKELAVKGDSTFLGSLSSEEFISGFLTGKGWAITKTEYSNAAGVPETKYTGEFDNMIIRGTLRVFEMIISQLLGENDNRVFTSMMEVDHYDPATGKVYLDTQDGKFYNPFRKDDYIMVQQFNGMPSEENDYYVTKHYELIITDAGCGSLEQGESRLDWVTFKNFIGPDPDIKPEDFIGKGDTFVRVDNLSNPERKGLVQVITVGSKTPYLDVAYGLKTDPDNALKGRMGNLEGIRHHLFGWLKGFGELLTNLYAVGDFRLRRTGENVDSKIEMLKHTFATQYQRVNYDLTEEDNYLTNATFTENMNGWQIETEAEIISSNNEALLVNGSIASVTGKLATIAMYDGRNMLRIRNSGVTQENSLIRKPGTHKEYLTDVDNGATEAYKVVKNTIYLSVKFLAKTSGTLTIGFQGAQSDVDALPNPATVEVSSSLEWQILEWGGTWDGRGKFVISYTGEMFVALLSITDKPLDDLRKEVSTSIEQTATNIRLLGTNIDNVNGRVTQLGIDLDAANERISIYANKTTTLETNVGNLTTTVTQLGVDLDAAEATITIHASTLTSHSASIAALQVKDDEIILSVAGVSGDLEDAKETAAAASKAASDAATAAQSTADSAWLKAYYAQEDADTNASDIKDINDTLGEHATAIVQNENSISAIAGRFDENGKLIEGSGWVTTSSYNAFYSQVTGELATKAEISTSVQWDPNTGYVTSNIILTADKIKLEGYTTINDSFSVDTNGTTRIGGFRVSGNGLTNANANGNFTNDAYIIFRNDTHKCFAGIGGNVLPTTSGLRAVARFENEDTADWWGLQRNIAVLLYAKNGQYNHAFLGSGNGNLDGWIGGYKYSKYTLTKANTIYAGYSNLKDNNCWVIHSSVSGAGITLPKLTEVRDALCINTVTKFCVLFTIIADLDSNNFHIYGRNSKKNSSNETPWNTSEMPNLVHWNNDHWDTCEMGAGDSLTVLLIYDSSKSGTKGGFGLTYTARIINHQS